MGLVVCVTGIEGSERGAVVMGEQSRIAALREPGMLPIGARLRGLVAIVGKAPKGWPSGLYVVTAPSCVGTIRIAGSVAEHSSPLRAWIAVGGEDLPPLKPIVVQGTILRTELAINLRTPQAILIGVDGRVWRRTIVDSVAEWRRFRAQCPTEALGRGGLQGCGVGYVDGDDSDVRAKVRWVKWSGNMTETLFDMDDSHVLA